MEKIKCICCDSIMDVKYINIDDFLFKVDGNFNFYECLNCKTIKLDCINSDINRYPDKYSRRKIPSKKYLIYIYRLMCESIAKLYFKLNINNGLFNSLFLKIIYVLKFCYRNEKIFIDEMKLTNGRLLDIGCGNGQFLKFINYLGWNAEGVETDINSLEIAKNSGLTIHYGDIKDLRLAINSYNIITLRHVIEHVSDPIRLINHCYGLLKENGILIILTPNSTSYCSQKYGSDWLGLDVSRHEYIYSKYGIMGLYYKTKYSKIKIINSLRITRFVSKASYMRSYKRNIYTDKSKIANINSIFDYLKAKYLAKDGGDELIVKLYK